MRYIMSAIWAILISFAVSYVLVSMGGEAFSVGDSLILAAIFFIATVLLGDGVLKESNE